MHYSIRQDNFPQLFANNFLPNIPIKQLKRKRCYPPNGFLWSVCEYNLVFNLKGLDAMNAYDQIDKVGAVEILYDNGFEDKDIAQPLSENHDTSHKIMNAGLMEFYVIGKEFSWCYIVTHEFDACGPYLILRTGVNPNER